MAGGSTGRDGPGPGSGRSREGGLLVVLSFGGLFVLDALDVGSFIVGRPDTITFVFSYLNTPTEISISIGPGIPIVGALVGLVYSFVRTYRRRGDPNRPGL